MLDPSKAKDVERVARALNHAVPDGVESGVVMTALMMLLEIGIARGSPEERLKNLRKAAARFSELLLEFEHGVRQ